MTNLYKMTAKMIMNVIKKELGADYDSLEKYDGDIITNDYGMSFMKVSLSKDTEEWADFCEDKFVAILFDAINIIQYGKVLKCDDFDLSYYELGRDEI